jgi:hypothetical protein
VGYTLENVGNSHVYFVKGHETALMSEPPTLSDKYYARRRVGDGDGENDLQ